MCTGMYFEFRVICSFEGYSRLDLFINFCVWFLAFLLLACSGVCWSCIMTCPNLTEEWYSATWKHLIPAATTPPTRRLAITHEVLVRTRIRVHALLIFHILPSLAGCPIPNDILLSSRHARFFLKKEGWSRIPHPNSIGMFLLPSEFSSTPHIFPFFPSFLASLILTSTPFRIIIIKIGSSPCNRGLVLYFRLFVLLGHNGHTRQTWPGHEGGHLFGSARVEWQKTDRDHDSSTMQISLAIQVLKSLIISNA